MLFVLTGSRLGQETECVVAVFELWGLDYHLQALLCTLEIVKIEVNLSKTILGLVIEVIALDRLNITNMSLLKLVLRVINFANNEVEVTPQLVNFLPEAWVLLLAGVTLL